MSLIKVGDKVVVKAFSLGGNKREVYYTPKMSQFIGFTGEVTFMDLGELPYCVSFNLGGGLSKDWWFFPEDLQKVGGSFSPEEEMKAYLRILANFGGTIQQAKELAQKCLEKLDYGSK